MRLTATCPVILFLLIATGNSQSANDQGNESSKAAEKTSKDSQMTSDQPAVSNGVTISAEKIPGKEDNDLDSNRDVTVDELLLFESLINDEKIFQVHTDSISPAIKDGSVKDIDIDGTSATPVESRIPPDGIDLRRQGEINPEFQKKGTTSPVVLFDDSREESKTDSPRFGQRKRRPSNSRIQEEAPVLQLTQGGYRRPYDKPRRVQNRQIERPDSSEQSERVQEPEKNANDNRQELAAQRIVPQVTYSAPVQQQRHYTFGPGPVLQSAFEVPQRYVSSVNHIVPTAVQNRFPNVPQTNYLSYNTPPTFQAQFPPSNDIEYNNFARGPGSTDFYQSPQRNPFENTGLFYQGAPQMQAQPIFIDPTRNMQPQFPPNNPSVYPNFENSGDGSRVNFAQYFNNPSLSPQFQVPPNFYGANPNEEINTFKNPSGSFLSNYPRSNDNRLSSQFFRYPVAPNMQQQQQSVNDQQLASDDSQENRESKVAGPKEDNSSANSGDSVSSEFGTRVQPQNEDVFIRYPTNEAGYATEENLPPQNGSVEAKDNGQRSLPERTNFPSRDPYREALNSVRGQRLNETRNYVPEELFKDVPVDFGYQRPQNSVFLEYPGGQRDVTSYPTPDFNSRTPFGSFAPAAENNYAFLNAVEQRRNHQAFDKVPSCAKNNVFFCFEDNEYPRNDIMYSINSNPFLMDRLSGASDLKLDSVSLVEKKNVTESRQQVDENYACSVDTKYGSPMRAKNLAGSWRVIVNLGSLTQPVRMEACSSIGDPCNYADSGIKTTCVQKFSLQRLLVWTPDRGVFLDVFKIPVACSCQILKASEKA